MQSSNQDISNQYSRRSFIKTGTVAAAGLSLAGYGFAAPQTEKLAMSGGSKTVTFPGKQLADLTRWPRYGDAEKKVLCDLLDNNAFYAELPAFERNGRITPSRRSFGTTSTARVR